MELALQGTREQYTYVYRNTMSPAFTWHDNQVYLRLQQSYVIRHFVALAQAIEIGCSKSKGFLGNVQLEHILFYFHYLFQLLFELEKKSSLVTRALSAKSCTHDTDSLHSCTQLTPRAWDGLSGRESPHNFKDPNCIFWANSIVAKKKSSFYICHTVSKINHSSIISKERCNVVWQGKIVLWGYLNCKYIFVAFVCRTWVWKLVWNCLTFDALGISLMLMIIVVTCQQIMTFIMLEIP